MTHRDRENSLSGRRKAAGDAAHRQGFSTPSDRLFSRPKRRLPATFGSRRNRLAMPRIAAATTPNRKTRETVWMGHDQRSLVSVLM
jgi:hypothetical protein